MDTKDNEYTIDSSNLLMSLISQPISCSYSKNDSLNLSLGTKPPVCKKITMENNLHLDLDLYTIPENSSEEQTHRSDEIENKREASSPSSGFQSENSPTNLSKHCEDLTIEDIEDDINIDFVEKQTDMILQDLQNEQIQLSEIVSDLDKLFAEGDEHGKVTEEEREIELEPVSDNRKIESDAKPEASTFGDIVTILEELEKENCVDSKPTSSRLKQGKKKPDAINTTACKDYSELLCYLDEIDQNCIDSIKAAKQRVQTVTEMTNAVTGVRFDSIPKIDDLLHHTNLELANYVVDLSMRLEDKSSSVSLLKTEITKLHRMISNGEQDRERLIKQKLSTEKNKYENVIKRHQTFIDQLIADKKELNDKCERLMSELKTVESRHARKTQSIEQRHKVEIRRCRDMHEAAEKTKREKWMETKTNRIKEMTARSVEHEMQSMTDKYQKEITETKSNHKREIEELELRAARKTQQQCEALREQLTMEREDAIANERDALKRRFEKLVEQEERSYQEQKRRLKDEHAVRIDELKQKERDLEVEKEEYVNGVKQECEERLETAKRRHDLQINNVEESMRLEMEMWKNKFVKQQSARLANLEAKLRETCRKERDREIEMVIDRLEKESDQTKRELESSADNRLRRLKEKHEEEINILKKDEREYKTRHEMMQSELVIQEETMRKLKSTLSELQDERIQFQKMSDRLSMEKRNLREITKQEFITEINQLKDQLGSMTNQKEKELQDIYTRVRSSITRKDQQIAKLSEDNIGLHEKCNLLENMLEQQRKDLLIR